MLEWDETGYVKELFYQVDFKTIISVFVDGSM